MFDGAKLPFDICQVFQTLFSNIKNLLKDQTWPNLILDFILPFLKMKQRYSPKYSFEIIFVCFFYTVLVYFFKSLHRTSISFIVQALYV